MTSTLEKTTARRPRRVPGAVPVLGHVPMILRSRFELIEKARPMGPVCEIKVGPQTAYFVNDHELLASMLVSDADKFVRGIHFKKMQNIVGRGVVTTSGDLHRRQRRTMLPSFSQRRQQIQIPIMRRIMSRFVRSLPEGAPYDLMGPVMAVGCDITASSLFGEDCPREVLDTVQEGVPVFVSNAAIHALDITGVYQHLPTRSNRDFRRLLGKIDEYVFSVIAARRRDLGGVDTRVAGDLLDALIAARDPETGQPFDDQEIRDHSITMLMASTETTANTIAWTCFEMARHPRIAQACRQEVLEKLDGREIEELEIGRADLPLTKRALMEALRMYPSSYLLSREAAEDIMLGDYLIPEGSTLLYSHYGQQRDERLFSHADEFDPDRWLAENTAEVTPDAYMPFGHGAYRCLGETIATIESMYCVAMMLATWDIDLAEHATPQMNGNITLSPKNLEFVFSARKLDGYEEESA